MANTEEQRMAEKSRAILGMMPTQARPPQMQQPTDLSQLRPVVKQTVSEQEKRAEMVVNATWRLFQNAIG